MRCRCLWLRIAVLVLLVCCGLPACGGGGAGPSDTAPPPITLDSLTGTWFGTLWDYDTFAAPSVSMTVNAVGNVTRFAVDGVPQGTGFATHVVGQRFLLDLGAFAAVTMSVDAWATHATGITDERRVLILEKGATSLAPPFLDSHFRNYTWAGHSFGVNAALVVDATAQGTLTVAADGTYSGAVGATAFLGGPVSVDTASGLIWADYEAGGGVGGLLLLWISPDKTCLHGFAMPSTGTWPHDATFLVWSRQ